MTFKLEKDGQVTRSYAVGGQPQAMDDEARRWLARVLPAMLRETGLQREQRIDRLMAKAGPAAAHRAAAFEACRWIIDTLKKTVPIWKKEYFEDGAVWADGEPFPEEIRGRQK